MGGFLFRSWIIHSGGFVWDSMNCVLVATITDLSFRVRMGVGLRDTAFCRRHDVIDDITANVISFTNEG